MESGSQPIATYRLQFNHDFRFSDAQALVPYFSRLGVTHLYASPLLRARQTSTHGYDVVDPTTINPNLGDKTDLVSLVTDLRKFGIGLIIDIVPNHMAASIENPYWRDVLTYGPSSPFARWFDIKWRMPDPDMWGRVLVPVLGEPRSRVLEKDQIQLIWSDGRFLVQYFEHVYPVDPATIPDVCEFGLGELTAELPTDHPALAKIAEVLDQLRKLPRLVVRLRRNVTIDRNETEQWLGQFAQVVVQSPRVQQWAARTAEQFGQGDEGRRRIKKLLDSQPYRLVHWRDAARTINYRRFFDINELVSIRQEDPHVFADTHATILRWISDDLVDGLRIDHIDGLRDPLGYLQRLTKSIEETDRAGAAVPIFVEKILAPDESLPPEWPIAGTTGYEFLNELEAIFISPDGFVEIEQLYRNIVRRPVRFEQIATRSKRRVLRNDLSPQVGRLADTLLRLATKTRPGQSAADGESPHAKFANPASSEAASGYPNPNSDVASVAVLSHSDLTKSDFVEAIVEVITALSVYRTYVDSHTSQLCAADRKRIESALAAARRSGRADPDAMDFLGEVLLLANEQALLPHELSERVNFIQRFQQLSGPAAAKGIEDTALYFYVPLVSMNEVGGEPWHESAAGGSVLSDGNGSDVHLDRLHAANLERATTHPQSMLCVTTHDTKRTADVRARIDVLSEMPKLWAGIVRKWQRHNEPHRSTVRGMRVPNAEIEYLLYQTLLGIWPAPSTSQRELLPSGEALIDLRERTERYVLKAAREAKSHTSWTNCNQQYEDALVSFVRSLFIEAQGGGWPYLTELQSLVGRIVRPGYWNSLARTLVQFTAPGSPDLYQGDELWNFALVDPDNRRPVDYETRQALLDKVIVGSEEPEDSRRRFLRGLVESPDDGRIKLHLVHSALAVRRERPRLFASGQYLRLDAEGAACDHVFAFARIAGKSSFGAPSNPGQTASGGAAIIVVPRLTTALLSDPMAAPIGEAAWADTTISLPAALIDHTWTCALSRETLSPSPDNKLRLAEIFQFFPAALLVSSESETTAS
jgi:(1->4)-alpha-D-glucan 1-alpha-D-glucosylmutase